LSSARQDLRDNPTLNNPRSVEQILEALKVQTSARRTNLVVRIPTRAEGVAVNGKALPNLPASMVQIIGSSRRTRAQAMGAALVGREATAWVLHGSESQRFTVTKNKKVLERD